METFSLIVSILMFVMMLVIVFLFFKKNQPDTKDDKAILMLQQNINDLTRQLNEKIDRSNESSSKVLRHYSEEINKISRDTSEKLGKLEETNKQVVSFADQLRQLQDILKNPKQRGVLGEYYLETVLKNVLPPGSYKMQYAFKNGEAVDAVVFVKEKIVPVDSKFSLENYNRIAEEKNEAERAKLEKVFVNDLKNRIVETSKYIRPNEGTTDFAFMFIPHEAIYYDLLVNKVGTLKDDDTNNILQKAASKYKVIIVSPTSFLAYLQTVLQGLKSLQIEESAKEIIKNVEKLQKHLLSYESYHSKLGSQLSTVVNTYNSSNKEFSKIDKDVLKISGKTSDLDLEDIEKPRLE